MHPVCSILGRERAGTLRYVSMIIWVPNMVLVKNEGQHKAFAPQPSSYLPGIEAYLLVTIFWFALNLSFGHQTPGSDFKSEPLKDTAREISRDGWKVTGKPLSSPSSFQLIQAGAG